MYDLTTLTERLRALSDEQYRSFNESLTPGIEGRSFGVRMPALRALSRELRQDAPAFLDATLHSDVHELELLHALVLAQMEAPLPARIERLRAFVPALSNWAVCDVLCSDLKPACDALPAYWELIEGFSRSPREVEVRFALVMLMLYFHGDSWIDRTLDIYARFSHEGYYARMGAAWGLSMLFVRQREKTLRLLKTDALDAFTHNKAIQKCIESRQISTEDKQLLRALRRRPDK